MTRDGAEADLGFARRWLDAAEKLMATKYHIVPDRYHMSVNLLYRPENDFDATQSGQSLLLDGRPGSEDRGASTFDEALARETKPCSPSELLNPFRKWLADSPRPTVAISSCTAALRAFQIHCEDAASLREACCRWCV